MTDELEIIPLYSSSQGNSTLINCNGSRFLIDCGKSCKQTEAALMEVGVYPDDIECIFVTHGHTDHIGGVDVFVRKHHAAVFATSVSRRKMREIATKDNDASSYYTIEENEIVTLDCAAEVMALPTPHDISGSVVYKIKNLITGSTVAVMTDLGTFNPAMEGFSKGVDAILIESNYDPVMLRTGPYPYPLQKRISGGKGHISNDECARQVKRLYDSGTRKFILGHLSPNNNTDEKALSCTADYMLQFGIKAGRDFELRTARKTGPTEGFSV